VNRRYLALGDSYTIGEGVEPAQTWPHLLAARLSTPSAPMACDVIARTGWTADELLAAIENATLSPPYALVSVLIGVNDQYRGREVEEHVPAFNTLLNQAIGFADGDPGCVVVVSIPDWGVSDFGGDDARGRDTIAAQIDAYNAAQRELCEMRGIRYVDITHISRAAAGDATMFVEDRLHPSPLQYRAWLDRIEEAARACAG
jgi:lysophospholipase L1-like esterase